MHIIFMGMGGPLSSVPLQCLLQAGFEIGAVVIAASRQDVPWRRVARPASYPAAPQSLPLVTPFVTRSIAQLAWEHDIALYEVRDLRAEEVQEGWRLLAPDVVLVSCFAQRVPTRLLTLPKHGFLNLHPSMLPAYRGPHPLFWQLRDGLTEIGITVHRMDRGLDTGDIALQTTVALADGLSGAEIERLAGEAGGHLFVKALQAAAVNSLSLQRQGPGGSKQGSPQDKDFALDRAWSARRAFNFMRGTAEWGKPYSLDVGGRLWHLRRALSYNPGLTQGAPVKAEGNRLKIQFNSGVLEAV